MLRYVRSLGLLATSLLAACGGGASPEVTYYRDVEPIIASKCQGCHKPDGIAPFALMTYEDVKSHARAVGAAVVSREMPPWPPGQDGMPLLLNRSLSDNQIKKVSSWVHEGMPEGRLEDHKTYMPELVALRDDLTLSMPEPYQPSGDSNDDYRCYVIDPKLDDDRFVTGYEIRPGASAMVHHVNLYLVTDPDAIADVERFDADDDKPGYACVGGLGGRADATSRIVGGWEPGAQAVSFPADTALRLPKGARVVMLMHYTTENERIDDLTRVALQLGDRPKEEASILELRDLELKVPPGATRYTVEQEQEIGPDFMASTIYSVFPHMHFFGTAVSVTLERRDGGAETLIHIPKWEYHWQGMYFLVNPVTVQPGDRLKIACTYDNSDAKHEEIEGNGHESRELDWGPRAIDEMCLAYLYVTNAGGN